MVPYFRDIKVGTSNSPEDKDKMTFLPLSKSFLRLSGRNPTRL
ncbi:hypothetical protein [Helicobacter suis]|nr:hypothetical protein [Helicobacter suis]